MTIYRNAERRWGTLTSKPNVMIVHIKLLTKLSIKLDDAFHLSKRKPQLKWPSKHMKVTDGPSKDVSFCKSNLQTVKKNDFNASW